MSIKFNPFTGQFDIAGSGGAATTWTGSAPTESGLSTSNNSDGDAKVTLDTDYVWVWDVSTTRWINQGIKVAAIGSSPNANGYSLSYSNVASNRRELQLVLQPADGTNPGIVTTGSQTIAGAKTFSGTTTVGQLIDSGLTASTVPYADSSKQLTSSSVTPTELGYVHGVTSAIQTQMDLKAPLASPTFTGTVTTPVTANRALVTGASSQLVAATTTDTEIGYVNGVTSAIQTQFSNKQPLDATLTALAAYNTNGILTQTAADTFTGRTITSGSGISVSNGNGVSGNPTISMSLAPSAGDIAETSFTAADNQSAAANVTSFAFANATVRSFQALVSIIRNTTYEQYIFKGIQKGSSWEMSQEALGDDAGFVFSITTAGQIQYTTTSTGSTATVKFRAITTSV